MMAKADSKKALTPAGAILPEILKPEHDPPTSPEDDKRAAFLRFCRELNYPAGSKLYDLINADPTGFLAELAEIFPGLFRPASGLTPIQARLIDSPPEDLDEAILYQHSILCQTCMPYQDPGDGIREWLRRNGNVDLKIYAGDAKTPEGEWVKLGLPFGPKPRLVLYYLNAEAMRAQSPVIELEGSLTAFVERTLGNTKGRNIRTVKEQLARLASSDFRLGASDGQRAITVKGTVIKSFELWTPKDSRQKVLFPTVVEFSRDYFYDLMQHAVPLDRDAIRRLAHTAVGLDVYTWLSQRLHRVPPGPGQFVPWIRLKEQFGEGYDRIRDFKRFFRRMLKLVKIVYPDACFDVDDRGMLLQQSHPPIRKKLVQIK
jgi:Plasmid encoded RepA protein